MPNCTSPRYTRSLNLRLFQNPPPILTHNAAKNGIRGLAVLQLFFFAFFPFHFSRIGRRGRNTRSVLLTSPERAKNKRAQKKKNAHAGSRYYYRLSSLKLSITLFLQPKKRGGRRGGHPTRAKSGKPELAAPREEQKNEQRARLVFRRLTFSPRLSFLLRNASCLFWGRPNVPKPWRQQQQGRSRQAAPDSASRAGASLSSFGRGDFYFSIYCPLPAR